MEKATRAKIKSADQRCADLNSAARAAQQAWRHELKTEEDAAVRRAAQLTREEQARRDRAEQIKAAKAAEANEKMAASAASKAAFEARVQLKRKGDSASFTKADTTSAASASPTGSPAL